MTETLIFAVAWILFLRGGVTCNVAGFCLLFLLPAHVQTGLRNAGFQNGCGYRIHLSGTHWATPFIPQDAELEAWLHPNTTVFHGTYMNSMVHVIRPNGYYARAEHDAFFDNSFVRVIRSTDNTFAHVIRHELPFVDTYYLPFDDGQVVILFAVRFPALEVAEILASDLVRKLKRHCFFPDVQEFAGYMVNQPCCNSCPAEIRDE